MNTPTSQAALYQNESLLEDIDQFSAACSHDLKDPLRLVLEQCKVLQGDVQGKAKSHIANIEEYITQTIERIEHMRDYGFLIQNTEKETDIKSAELLIEAAKACKPLIEKTGARIQHGPLPIIKARRKQLVLLLTCLLDNAMKYNDSMPPVIEVRIEDAGPHWKLRVRDNGQGMDQEYSYLVFGLFRRIGLESDPPGLGTGLAYCRKIAENHGGTISMDSQFGEYTEMCVTLSK